MRVVYMKTYRLITGAFCDKKMALRLTLNC